MTNPTPQLTEAEVAAIENRLSDCDTDATMQSACGEYNCECHYQIPALIRDWRAMQAQLVEAAEIYDAMAEAASQTEQENVALREQLAETEHELRRRRNGDELPSDWTGIDVGDGFPNLYLYSHADIVAQAKTRFDGLQSQLAEAIEGHQGLRHLADGFQKERDSEARRANEWKLKADELQSQLAQVTSERDEMRREAGINATFTQTFPCGHVGPKHHTICHECNPLEARSDQLTTNEE